MANARNGNTHYVDSTGDLTTEANIKVAYITITATGASAILVLQTPAGVNKADLRVVTSGATQVFDFSRSPLVFPTGVKVSTLTNCVATIVYTQKGGT